MIIKKKIKFLRGSGITGNHSCNKNIDLKKIVIHSEENTNKFTNLIDKNMMLNNNTIINLKENLEIIDNTLKPLQDAISKEKLDKVKKKSFRIGIFFNEKCLHAYYKIFLNIDTLEEKFNILISINLSNQHKEFIDKYENLLKLYKKLIGDYINTFIEISKNKVPKIPNTNNIYQKLETNLKKNNSKEVSENNKSKSESNKNNNEQGNTKKENKNNKKITNESIKQENTNKENKNNKKITNESIEQGNKKNENKNNKKKINESPKIKITDLNSSINMYLDKFREFIYKEKNNLKIEQDDSPEIILKKISDFCNGEYSYADVNKRLYRLLNKYVKQIEDDDSEIGGEKIFKDERFNLLVFSKMVNGMALDYSWPPDEQRSLFVTGLYPQKSLSEMFGFNGESKNIQNEQKDDEKKDNE